MLTGKGSTVGRSDEAEFLFLFLAVHSSIPIAQLLKHLNFLKVCCISIFTMTSARGFIGKYIAASKIVPKSSIYQIGRNFKEISSCYKEGFRVPKEV